MSMINPSLSKKRTYSVVYSGMRGVNLSSDQSSSKKRYAYAENMYRDYEGDGGDLIESIPGFRKILSVGENINGIFSFSDEEGKTQIVIHAGENVYVYPEKDKDSLERGEPAIKAANAKSRAVRYGSALYLLDGKGIIKITSSLAARVSDGGPAAPYVPTTYRQGERYEQRNLLTEKFKERYIISSAKAAAYGTRGLSYEITDLQGRECAVVGIGTAKGDIEVPSEVLIGDELFSVTQIADKAFYQCADITRLYVPSGVSRIGTLACAYCPNLIAVCMKDSVRIIGNGAFAESHALQTVYIGGGVEEIGRTAFSMCTALKSIYYAKESEDFNKIINHEGVPEVSNFTFNSPYLTFAFYIPIFTPARCVDALFIGGKSYPFYTLKDENGKIVGLRASADRVGTVEGEEAVIHAVASSNRDDYENHGGFMASAFSELVSSASEAVSHATIAERFDGKIFLAASPKLPGVCFYSTSDDTGENNPLYFGENNYFADGEGVYKTVSLLATSGALAVFNSADSSSAGIYYHVPKETGIDIIPKIYPVSYVHKGVSAGEAISFFDDPVFVTERGICGLDKQNINLERSVSLRSSAINASLLSERCEDILLAVWCGYLAVCSRGRIFLADSRSRYVGPLGEVEYDWFYLSGIGTYTEDAPVYRYYSTPSYDFAAPDMPDERVSHDKTVMSREIGGELVYYVNENARAMRLYKTEERTGGRFHPATAVHATGGLLFFGTENGDVCVFNNDMRGVPPDFIASEADFDKDDYKKRFGRKIHPSFYSFAGHAPRYALKTISDNAGFPNLLKNTEKRSLTVKFRTFAKGKITCEVGTDGNGYYEICEFPTSSFSFSDLDFGNLSISTDDSFTALISEKEKGWVEKEIGIYSEEFASPFGVYSIAYRFSIKGYLRKSV